jgi:hypothetical protein
LRQNGAADIHLHAGWRCCSTYVWSRFRASPEAMAFYEPFYEQHARLTLRSISALHERSWQSRHPRLDQPYAMEYASLIDTVGVRGYHEDFAIRQYFQLETHEPRENAYLRRLSAAAAGHDRRAVYGYSRSLGRVRPLKASLGGHHLVIMRDPVQQWLSCRSYRQRHRYAYFELSHVLILALAPPGSIAHRYAQHLQLPAPPAVSVHEQLKFLWRAVGPLDDRMSFSVFLAVYLLSYAHALTVADLVIDMDCLAQSVSYRRSVTSACEGLTGLAPDFSDCALPAPHETPPGLELGALAREVLAATIGSPHHCWQTETNRHAAQIESYLHARLPAPPPARRQTQPWAARLRRLLVTVDAGSVQQV